VGATSLPDDGQRQGYTCHLGGAHAVHGDSHGGVDQPTLDMTGIHWIAFEGNVTEEVDIGHEM
jgi:hypothetical protein